MHAALLLALALQAPTQPTEPTSTPEPPSTPATNATTLQPSTLSWQQSLGVSLVAGGAGLATAGTAVFTLIEAQGKPDRVGNPVSEQQATFTQSAGFAAAAIASASAVVVVGGASMLLLDETTTTTATTASTTTTSP